MDHGVEWAVVEWSDGSTSMHTTELLKDLPNYDTLSRMADRDDDMLEEQTDKERQRRIYLITQHMSSSVSSSSSSSTSSLASSSSSSTFRSRKRSRPALHTLCSSRCAVVAPGELSYPFVCLHCGAADAAMCERVCVYAAPRVRPVRVSVWGEDEFVAVVEASCSLALVDEVVRRPYSFADIAVVSSDEDESEVEQHVATRQRAVDRHDGRVTRAAAQLLEEQRGTDGGAASSGAAAPSHRIRRVHGSRAGAGRVLWCCYQRVGQHGALRAGRQLRVLAAAV